MAKMIVVVVMAHLVMMVWTRNSITIYNTIEEDDNTNFSITFTFLMSIKSKQKGKASLMCVQSLPNNTNMVEMNTNDDTTICMIVIPTRALDSSLRSFLQRKYRYEMVRM